MKISHLFGTNRTKKARFLNMGTTESILYEDTPPSTEMHPSPSHGNSPSPRPRRKTHEGSQSSRRRVAKSKQIKRLNGLILGGPSTGKYTLLQRLKGNDPYEETNAKKKALSSIMIPYMPPAEKPSWDRIQLHVRSSRSVQEKVDFCVLLTSPRHDIEKTRAFIFNVLNRHMLHLGYSKGDGEDEADSNQSVEPVCICILFNFRDLQEKPPEFEDIENLVKAILKPVPKDKVVLQFASTCLRNCYGLNVLHNFIYRTYLQRKRADLEAQLKEVKTQMGNTGEPPLVAYDDFLKLIESPIKKSTSPEYEKNGGNNDDPAPSPTDDSYDLSSTPALKQQPEPDIPLEPQSQAQKRDSNDHNLNGKSTEEKVPGTGWPRRLYSPEKQPVQVGKAALEAFLASDSEEDEAPVSAKMVPQNDDSSDDEDDFFYDESGKRRFNHLAYKNQLAESSSSDEEVEEAKPIARQGKRLDDAKEAFQSFPEKNKFKERSRDRKQTVSQEMQNSLKAHDVDLDEEGSSGSGSEDAYKAKPNVDDSATKDDDTTPNLKREEGNEMEESYEQDPDRISREGEELGDSTMGQRADTSVLSLDSNEDRKETDDSTVEKNLKATLSDGEDSDEGEFFIESEEHDETLPTATSLPQPEPIEETNKTQVGADSNDTTVDSTEEHASTHGLSHESKDHSEIDSDKLVSAAKQQDDSDSEEFFLGDEKEPSAMHKPDTDVGDSDEEEFFVGGETTVAIQEEEPPKEDSKAKQVNTQSRPNSVSTSEISAAALAAIAAAQKEAEAMLMQQNVALPPVEKKAKKAKKKKEEKKKKKKKDKH